MKIAKLTFILFIFASTLLAASESIFGQRSADEPEIIASRNSGNGEVTNVYIGMIIGESKSSKERLFVIARLGKGEKLRRINRGRLVKAQNHLQRITLDLPPIYAEGERVKGEGRVEFYLGSRLKLVVLAERNKMPLFTCESCP